MSGETSSHTPEFLAVHYDGRIVGTRTHVIRVWPDRVGAWATCCGRITMRSREDRAAFLLVSDRVTRKCGRCAQCLHLAPPVSSVLPVGQVNP